MKFLIDTNMWSLHKYPCIDIRLKGMTIIPMWSFYGKKNFCIRTFAVIHMCPIDLSNYSEILHKVRVMEDFLSLLLNYLPWDTPSRNSYDEYIFEVYTTLYESASRRTCISRFFKIFFVRSKLILVAMLQNEQKENILLIQLPENMPRFIFEYYICIRRIVVT